VALVIGKVACRAGGALANSVSDAHRFAGASRRAEFRTIDTRTDLSITDFHRARRRFQALAHRAEVDLIDFAGHGIETNGAKWLIPTDAEVGLQTLQGARMSQQSVRAELPFGLAQGFVRPATGR